MSKNKKIVVISIAIGLFAVSYLVNYKNFPNAKVSLTADSSDVDLFYQVLDHAQENDIELNGEYFWNNYLLKGSPALKYLATRYEKFAKRQNKEERASELYWENLKGHLPFLEANKDVILGQRDILKQDVLDRMAQKLSTVLVEDLTSTFYFWVGNGTMGGTAFNQGIIIDLSMIKSDEFDYSKHPHPQILNYLSRKDDALFLYVHEIIHQLQAIYMDKDDITNRGYSTLGDPILEEGAGHFLAHFLVDEEYVPDHFYLDQERYYKENPEIMKEFLDSRGVKYQESNKDIITKWFFNMDQVKDYPNDLGYYLGSVVAYDYYKRAEDKKQAFVEIIKYWEYKDKIIDSYIENNM